MPPFEYSIEFPPTNWKLYPKSFLRAAIPILNAAGDYTVANQQLSKLGLTMLRKAKGCPEIESFTATKKGLLTVNYSYRIKANNKFGYIVVVSVYDRQGNYLQADTSTELVGKGTIQITGAEIFSVKLRVRPVSYNTVVDTKIITFKETQPPLF